MVATFTGTHRLAPLLDAEVMPAYRKVTASRDAARCWSMPEEAFRRAIDTPEIRQVDLRLVFPNRPALTFSTSCVVAEKPFFISWLSADSTELVETLRSWHWAGWLVGPRGAGLFEPDSRLVNMPRVFSSGVVFTRVSRTPLWAGRAIFKSASEQLATWASDANFELTLHWRTAPEVAEIREFLRQDAEAREELSRRGFHGFKNPVAGVCSACNRPLRDPASLARGMGPDCLARVGWVAQSNPALRYADIPPHRWVSGVPFSHWRAGVIRPDSTARPATRCGPVDIARAVTVARVGRQRTAGADS